MDESILRNLDTQHRRLAEAERTLAALLAGETPDPPAGPTAEGPAPGGEEYDALTARNDAIRAERAWREIDLDAALGSEQREAFERWRARQRLPWSVSDLAAVGFAGLIGLAATVYDTRIDRVVRERLLALKNTALFADFEKAGRNLAIDHTGPGFGGPGHRVRSSGHDLARPFAALRQISRGRFEGYEWVDGVRHLVERDAGHPVDSFAEALVRWTKHLVADIITPTSLPLPGWTLLYELPWRDVRKLAHDMYRGTSWGEGWNLRSGLITPTLPVLTTDAIIRTHIHVRARNATGSPVLDHAHAALRDELLLAAHSLVGAAALARTTALVFAGPGGALHLSGPNLLALRHLNLPSLLRIGSLTVQVATTTHRRRTSAAPTWDTLLTGVAQPWQLDEATCLEQALASDELPDDPSS